MSFRCAHIDRIRPGVARLWSAGGPADQCTSPRLVQLPLMMLTTEPSQFGRLPKLRQSDRVKTPAVAHVQQIALARAKYASKNPSTLSTGPGPTAPAGLASKLEKDPALPTPEKEPAICQGKVNKHHDSRMMMQKMLTSIASTPPCLAMLYCTVTGISNVSSISRAIFCSSALGSIEETLTNRL
jgi:hypothetical protein